MFELKMSAQDRNVGGQTVWEDIRAETGYSSYKEYLVKTKQTSSFWAEQEPYDDGGPPPKSWSIMCSVIDLSRIADSDITVSVQDFYSESNTNPKPTAKELLQTLRQPPQTTCLRVVLWWLDGTQTVPAELLDVCGLGLKIGPHFFEALIERANQRPNASDRQLTVVRPFQPNDPFQPTYTVISNQIATVARNYIMDQAATPPVLLIVGWNDNDWDDQHFHYSNDPHLLKRDWDAVDVSPFRFATVDETPRDDTEVPTGSLFFRSRTYVKILDHLLKQNRSAAIGNQQLLVLSTLPMMHLDTLHMNAKIRSLRPAHLDESEALVQWENAKIRVHIEHTETSGKNFSRYAHSENGGDLLSRQEYLRIEELWRDALSEARLLETQVRDALQLNASFKSIDESKKSIELSNHQIEESRRVRIFTILAFVYVPLNTVTSIYGMNIQQINGSGHNIWIFAVTSMVALLVTGLTWYLIDEINKVRVILRKIDNDHLDGSPEYSLAFRVFMLWWLVLNGNLSWSWKTRAWSQILGNSNSEFHPLGEEHKFGWTIGGRKLYTACDYVAYHMSGEKRHIIKAFTLSSVPDGIALRIEYRPAN